MNRLTIYTLSDIVLNMKQKPQISKSMDLASTTRDLDTWPKISTFMIETDECESWKQTHRSFTGWVKDFGTSIGLKEGIVWRYFTAGKYFEELRVLLNDQGISTPTLDKLSPKVSPENLEILSKLERAAPIDSIIELANKVLDSQITRNELKKHWAVYRPLLQGKTARGLGVTTPKLNLSSPQQMDGLAHADIAKALLFSKGKWTGWNTPSLFRLFFDVTPDHGPAEEYVVFDAVAVVKRDEISPVEIHGIEITTSAMVFGLSKHLLMEKQKPYCDYLWIAIKDKELLPHDGQIPKNVGLITVSKGVIEIVSAPKELNVRSPQSLDLAKGLLLQLLTHQPS